MKIIKLEERKNVLLRDDFVCDITKAIDATNPNVFHGLNHTYMLDVSDKYTHAFIIRMIGMTIGSVFVNDDRVVTECKLDEHALDTCLFPEDINEKLSNFVGCQILLAD